MNKIFVAILLFVASTAWCATEYLRPTTSSVAGSGFGEACENGTYAGGATMTAVYSGKSGAGPTGSSATITGTFSSSQHYSEEYFHVWQTTGNTYTALTINLSASYSTTGSGAGVCAYYTTNNWSTEASLGTITSSQTTLSATITGANLTQVQVVVAAYSGPSSSSSATLTVYDIWTVGTYTASASHTHTWLLSYLDEQIWRWHDARREYLAQ